MELWKYQHLSQSIMYHIQFLSNANGVVVGGTPGNFDMGLWISQG